MCFPAKLFIMFIQLAWFSSTTWTIWVTSTQETSPDCLVSFSTGNLDGLLIVFHIFIEHYREKRLLYSPCIWTIFFFFGHNSQNEIKPFADYLQRIVLFQLLIFNNFKQSIGNISHNKGQERLMIDKEQWMTVTQESQNSYWCHCAK